jgi:hypothetical protein
MSRYLARLAKLEAVRPTPQPVPEEAGRTNNSLAGIIAQAKAKAEYLAAATPLQRLIFNCSEVARLETLLAESAKRSDRPLVEQLRKVQRVWLPSFLDTARAEVREAELVLLSEAGFSSIDQPGARAHLDHTLFDA